MRNIIGILFILSQIISVASKITLKPRDTAAKLDQQNVELNCTSDQEAASLKWQVHVPWIINPLQIFPNGNNPNYTSKADGSSINIKTLTNDHANIYICSDAEEYVSARVAAIDFLKCPADQKDLNPDDNVYSECSVNYRSFFKSPLEQLKMTIAMLDQNQKVLLKKRADVDGYLSINLNQTVSESFNDGPFFCQIFFEGDNEEPAFSLNLPWFTETCEYNIHVKQPTSKISVDDSLDLNGVNNVNVGDTINCTANGKPEPTINWLDTHDTVLSQNGTLVLTDQMLGENIYLCRAQQTGSVQSTVILNITLAVSNRQQEVVEAGTAPWVIAIAVIIPLIIILPLIILLIYCCLKKRDKKPFKPKATKVNKKDKNGSKAIYTAANTSDFMPSTNPYARSDSSKPKLQMANERLATQNAPSAYANQNEFGMNSGHGALGMPGLSNSKQEVSGSRNNAGFPTPPVKQAQPTYSSSGIKSPRPPLSETDSISPNRYDPSKKKPIPVQRDTSVTSNSTTRSEMTSGGEGRNGSERKKKKKGGEYMVNVKGTSPPPPPEQYRQKTGKNAKKGPASLPRRQDDSDGSEV